MTLRLLLFLLPLGALAQFDLTVVDEQSAPLVGAVVSMVSHVDNQSAYAITDASGQITSDLKMPVSTNVSYLGYHDLNVTVSQPSAVLKLEVDPTTLPSLVVTAQYQPQTMKNAVFKINSISEAEIEQVGSLTLTEILGKELNIQLGRDNATGRSNITMQGLSGQYVKVLLDGIPLEGRGGVSNDIDLNQIDVHTIERVEIVEGPMAVNYGADALAGVINIITKKGGKKLAVTAALQEETIGSAYSFFDEGIHNYQLNVTDRPVDHFRVSAGASFNKFGGWQGVSTGRQNDWYPKEQYLANALVGYSKDNWDVYYRLDMVDETLYNLGAANDLDPLRDPYAIDEQFITNRWVHQLQSDLYLGDVIYNAVFSYTDFDRYSHQYIQNLTVDNQLPIADHNQDTTRYQEFFTRQALNNLFHSKWWRMQLGLDAKNASVSATTLSDGEKSQTDLGGFATAEINLSKVTVRPGVRVNYSSAFASRPTASINIRYAINDQRQVRFSYGQGYRVPSLRELYHEFVDTNHHIVGNENLTPETSHSFNLNFEQSFEMPVTLQLDGYYNSLRNMITYYLPASGANQVTSYVNQDEHKTTGFNAALKYMGSIVSLELGLAYTGLYQRYQTSEEVPSFVFSPEFRAQVRYAPRLLPGFSAGTYYNLYGSRSIYQLDENSDVVQGEIGSYQMWDVVLSQQVDNFSLSLGAKNLLDVTNISGISGGGHSGGASRAVSYGRSYFLKVKYLFETKK